MSQIERGAHLNTLLAEQLEKAKGGAMKPYGIVEKTKYHADKAMMIAAQYPIYTRMNKMGRDFSNPPGRISLLIKLALKNHGKRSLYHTIYRISNAWSGALKWAHKTKTTPHLFIFHSQLGTLKAYSIPEHGDDE